VANIFGIELDNPTANTVVVELFQLGNSTSEITFSSVVQSETKEQSCPTSDGGVSSTFPFFFSGDTSTMFANPDIYFNVNAEDVGLSIATSNTLNSPLGNRDLHTFSGFNGVLSSVNPLNLQELSDSIVTNYNTLLSPSFNVNINPIAEVKYDSGLGATVVRVRFEVIYETAESNVIDPIEWIELNTDFTSTKFYFPPNSDPLTPLGANWNNTYTLSNGVVLNGSTGTDYGEFARSQTGEPIAINSLRITPLTSGTYDENERISQLLQPIKFTRVDSNGKSNTYCLNPTVDLYQYMTTLDYINLGTKTDDFPLDGNTNFSYALLPYAKVNIQLDYVQTSNFVFANKELVKEIVELNKKKNKQMQFKSKIAKEYTLDVK
tara:strand:+ start:21411 stop:22544 length:1134 start_codon:yes stop_codon:yes gene_type:complete